MSIPKEPRQLMINIMYLVLTALLALNVSAEIFNAFKIVDKGLVKSNDALDLSNDRLPEAIREGAKKKNSLATYAERIDPVRDLSSNMNTYLQGIMDSLIDMSGDNDGVVGEGDYVTSAGVKELKGKKNKDVTTRLLVYGNKGEELKEKLNQYIEDMKEYVDPEDMDAFLKDVPSMVDDETWKQKLGKKSWADFNFKQMPVQATLPILRKFQNDVKASESTFLNYLAKKVGTTTDVVLDKYTVVSAPEKSYVIKGDQFKTDLFLSAFASADSRTGIKIAVNGKTLPTDKDGKASFTQNANSVGIKKYTATASITNPTTGEVQNFKKVYEYEVGERSVTVSASKMNVFYVGVDNPLEVSAAGVPSDQVSVKMSGGGGTLKKNGDGTYNVRVTQPTPRGQFAKINVTAPGLQTSKDFRVKRIPDPVPKLGKVRGGTMGNGEFKLYSKLRADLENFDFDASCEIVGFRFVYAPKRKDIAVSVNPKGKYTADTQRLANMATPGDRYFFENIKCKCPGDKASRDLGSLSVNIK